MRTAFESWLLTQPAMSVPEAEAAWKAWQAAFSLMRPLQDDYEQVLEFDKLGPL